LKLKLKLYQDRAGLTQEGLARGTHLLFSTIQSVESDHRSALLDTLYKLAIALDVTINNLLFVYDNTNSTSLVQEVN